MARKTYKDLLEDQVKLAERIKELRQEEARKIGEYVLNEFDGVDTLADFKEWRKANTAKLKKALNGAQKASQAQPVQNPVRQAQAPQIAQERPSAVPVGN